MGTSLANHACDAVVVGAGPNGLAAAIRLAQAGLGVEVWEANDTLGGGARSAELTLPGFVHDLCSAVHPLAAASPFFRSLDLEPFGLKWLEPSMALAHPLEGDRAVALERSVEATARGLARDEVAYFRLMAPLVVDWPVLVREFLQPPLHWPRHPLPLARLGWSGLRSAAGLARARFRDEPARALLAGLAAHSSLPLEQVPSAAFGLVLGLLGHAVSWPLPSGGAQRIVNALAGLLRALGGEIFTGRRVELLDELPSARAILLDVTPHQLLRLAGEKLPANYRRGLERFRYGPGVFKIDYALGGPIPWRAAACRRAGTVHVGGTLEEIAAAEREAVRGTIPARPFVLLAQPSLVDTTRAPPGKHTAWAYCHVPSGSTVDMTGRMEQQIERFAPGFRDLVLARHTANCADLERQNANLIGGAIGGGTTDLWQMAARPVFSPTPYRTPIRGLYLCSSSTPPGPGVHGMSGWLAAEAALRDCFGRRP